MGGGRRAARCALRVGGPGSRVALDSGVGGSGGAINTPPPRAMPGAARLPVDDWAEQCERCRPAARALRHQLEDARARIVELESQVGRLQLEVGVLRVQPQPPMRRSLQAVSTPGGVDGGKGKMHGIMVPYRGPSSGASVSERERGGLPFSSASSTVSTYSYAAGRTPKLPTPPGMLVHAAPEGPGAVLARLLTKEFWTGQEDPQQRAAQAAKLLQARVRGWRQRARFRAAREVFAVVSGSSTFASPSFKRTVTTYIITVVRAGCCWQVGRAASAPPQTPTNKTTHAPPSAQPLSQRSRPSPHPPCFTHSKPCATTTRSLHPHPFPPPSLPPRRPVVPVPHPLPFTRRWSTATPTGAASTSFWPRPSGRGTPRSRPSRRASRSADQQSKRTANL